MEFYFIFSETAECAFYHHVQKHFDKKNAASLCEYSVPRSFMHEYYNLDTSKIHKTYDVSNTLKTCNFFVSIHLNK